MKLIFISGPSGSGKTTLSNQILVRINDGIVLNTDNYYKTGLISKLLSKFIQGYFDKSLSFNYKLFKKDFNLIVNSGISFHDRYYDFKKKSIKNFLNERKNIKFLIVEGIFAKEISSKLCKQKFILLELETDKNECMTRVVQRDIAERGKFKEQAKNDFLKSWDIYYEKFKNKYIKTNNDEFLITKKTNLDILIKKILN